MDKPVFHLLLLEDDNEFAFLVMHILKADESGQYQIEHARTLSEARTFLREQEFDAILMDLNVPDSAGLNTFNQMHEAMPEKPIVVLTSMEDEKAAIQAVKSGAQDYLNKTQLTVQMLQRAVRYAIERHRKQLALEQMAYLDELTGVYNRHGFQALCKKYLKLTQRRGQQVILIYADLDHLKQINDTYGHAEGDRVLRYAAELLRSTFRESDIVARIGGDEFVVLALDVGPENMEPMLQRLQEKLSLSSDSNHHLTYSFTLSIGVARASLDSVYEMEDLIAQADAAMYGKKQSRNKGSR